MAPGDLIGLAGLTLQDIKPPACSGKRADMGPESVPASSRNPRRHPSGMERRHGPERAMNTNRNETQAQNSNSAPAQGFYAQPRAYLSKDGEYLTLVLPGNMIVRKHVNFFKAILGVPYTAKTKSAGEGGETDGGAVA